MATTPVTTITISPLSRYRSTRAFSDLATQQVFFGTWKPPRIVLRRPVSFRTILPDEVFRPDLLAFRTYGNPNLFWAIALANNIMLPMRDMKVGQNLVLPHVEDVLAALTSAFNNSPGTF